MKKNRNRACCYYHADDYTRMTHMFVCSECGDKRCVKARDCANDCSGSVTNYDDSGRLYDSHVDYRERRAEPAEGSAEWRKQRPLVRGVLDYFPDALMEVAYCSFVGNNQHNPGEDLHWAKEKSTDEADALLRHLVERGTRDDDGVRHSAKVAWRALALLQRELDEEARLGKLAKLLHTPAPWDDAEKDN